MIDTMSFFFSSRRRHTILQGDWSSDVCSSDLGQRGRVGKRFAYQAESAHIEPHVRTCDRIAEHTGCGQQINVLASALINVTLVRSARLDVALNKALDADRQVAMLRSEERSLFDEAIHNLKKAVLGFWSLD